MNGENSGFLGIGVRNQAQIRKLGWKGFERISPVYQALTEALPLLIKRKCVFGRKKGGEVIQEIREGTDFAHILELQYLADPEKLIYSGWTRTKRDDPGSQVPSSYAIHYET